MEENKREQIPGKEELAAMSDHELINNLAEMGEPEIVWGFEEMREDRLKRERHARRWERFAFTDEWLQKLDEANKMLVASIMEMYNEAHSLAVDRKKRMEQGGKAFYECVSASLKVDDVDSDYDLTEGSGADIGVLRNMLYNKYICSCSFEYGTRKETMMDEAEDLLDPEMCDRDHWGKSLEEVEAVKPLHLCGPLLDMFAGFLLTVPDICAIRGYSYEISVTHQSECWANEV